MTEHDKKISGVEAPVNPVQQSAPSEGRRRLVKGALAAPAVMTLMHGRLAAAMSATCAQNVDETQVEPGWIAPNGNPLYIKEIDGKDTLVYDDSSSADGYTIYSDGALPGSCWTSITT